jgi:hypothetical protein
MTLPSADESLLRRYLLGAVTEEARKDLDTRLFSDDRIFWERISIAEDELVSDYVQNALKSEERQDFERHFLCTDERRAKLEFARALHTHATNHVSARAAQPRESRWAWLMRPALSPAWAVAAAALLLLVVQLPRFGTTGPGGNVSGLAVVEASVSAGRTRAAGGELPRVRLTADSRIVRLQLDPESSNFPTYRASLHQVDDDALLAEMRLTPSSTAGSTTLTLTLPAELLADGDYYVRLHGITTPGADPEPLQRYDFRVLRD